MKKIKELYEINFLHIEGMLVLLVTCAIIIYCEIYDGKYVIENIVGDRCSNIYSTLAGILGALLGFAITAESIVIGLSGNDKLLILRKSPHYKTLWKVFTKTIRWLGIATLMALVGILVDKNGLFSIVFYVFTYFFLLAGVRLFRTIWVLENIIHLLTLQDR